MLRALLKRRVMRLQRIRSQATDPSTAENEDRLMSRIPIPSLADTPADTHATLQGVSRRLGWTPNTFLLMALSPSTLATFVALVRDAFSDTGRCDDRVDFCSPAS
jgi:hypothetical protein